MLRKWTNRHLVKLLKQDLNPLVPGDMERLLIEACTLSKRAWRIPSPEHRGFTDLKSRTSSLMDLRKRLIDIRSLMAHSKDTERYMEVFHKILPTERTLQDYLGALQYDEKAFSKYVYDFIHSFDVFIETILTHEDSGYLYRLHEPLFIDLFCFMQAFFIKGASTKTII